MRFLLVLMLFAFSAMSYASNIDLSTSNITLEQSVDVDLDIVKTMDLEIDQDILHVMVEETVEQNKLNKNTPQRILAHLSKRSEYRHLGVNHPLLWHHNQA